MSVRHHYTIWHQFTTSSSLSPVSRTNGSEFTYRCANTKKLSLQILIALLQILIKFWFFLPKINTWHVLGGPGCFGMEWPLFVYVGPKHNRSQEHCYKNNKAHYIKYKYINSNFCDCLSRPRLRCVHWAVSLLWTKNTWELWLVDLLTVIYSGISTDITELSH